MQTREARIAQLERQLATLRKEKDDEQKAAREATPVIMQYSIERVHPQSRRWDKVWDDTCILYSISGQCVNRDEAQAVGHRPHEGAMTYLFNSATGKIVMSTGGGSVFIGGGFTDQDEAAAAVAFDKVNAFLAENPHGGDITEIVEEYRVRGDK